jgi:hypothetical protein
MDRNPWWAVTVGTAGPAVRVVGSVFDFESAMRTIRRIVPTASSKIHGSGLGRDEQLACSSDGKIQSLSFNRSIGRPASWSPLPNRPPSKKQNPRGWCPRAFPILYILSAIYSRLRRVRRSAISPPIPSTKSAPVDGSGTAAGL